MTLKHMNQFCRTFVVLAAAALLPSLAVGESPQPADGNLYLKVLLRRTVKVSALKAGDMVEGTLARDVYSAGSRLFPAGSQVRLTVGGTERRRKVVNDHWPWIVRALGPRRENFPLFSDARVTNPEGEERALQVSLISVSWKFEVRAKSKGKQDFSIDASASANTGMASGEKQENAGGPVMILEALSTAQSSTVQSSEARSSEVRSPTPPSQASDAAPSPLSSPSFQSATLPGGTQCRILLLKTISASTSRVSEQVQARLLEPVVLNDRVVLPAGSVFDGTIVKRTPPRRLSRAGSISLTFNAVILPDGNRYDLSASLTGAELDRGSHTRIDSEGRLRGERPGKLWMLINGGMTAGISKAADDSAQLIIEAIVSTATDASTAGISRIVASCASGAFLLTRRGRDVILPRFTEMQIVLNRPLSVGLPAVTVAAASVDSE
jgi:hypothetical protein